MQAPVTGKQVDRADRPAIPSEWFMAAIGSGAAAAGLAALLVAAPLQAADSFQLSTGADYSSGDFGAGTDTEVLVVPLSARLRLGGWALRATLPYLSVHGPADVIVIADDSGSGSSSSSGSGLSGDDTPEVGDDRGDNDSFADNRSVSGIGDATLSLTRSFNAIADTPFYVDVGGRVKFATGSSAKGLGVGATDYSAAAESGCIGRFGGLYLAGARRFLGSSASLRRVDGWQWSGGGWLNLGPAVELGSVYSWRKASVPTGIDSRAVEVNLSLRLGDAWRASLFASHGLSDGSPDYAGGLSLSWQARL